ncbi:MAG: peptidylprolyl isomerase [Gemmatimonadaceae bacterium]
MLQLMRDVRVQRAIWFTVFLTFVGVFLLADTSGLLSRGAITTNTAVATVNGRDILYTALARAEQQAEQQETQRLGRSPTLDEKRRIDDEAFDQMVAEVLLEQEYKKRGISVSDEEIQQAALYAPPPALRNDPALMTEGRFDLAKWQRNLRSPQLRASGQLAMLEALYRNEIPKEKLFAQIASGTYVPTAKLRRVYADQHDSAQVSFISLRPELVPDSTVSVPEAEINAYWEAHAKEFDRPGRATVSLLIVPRIVTAADTAAARARIAALRTEIVRGSRFADVAKRESQDSGSAANGGALPPGPASGYVAEFAAAASRLKVGELSEPVQTAFGFHLLTLDSRRGDTLALRHILIRIQQSDSSAARVDRRADSLARMAAATEKPTRFDSAAKVLGLVPVRVQVVEGQPATLEGRYLPSVSAWAFSKPKVGETSDLFDAESAYYLARLDSLTPGGVPTLSSVRDEVIRLVSREKKIQHLRTLGEEIARAASGAGSLEQAAKTHGLSVTQSRPFTRGSLVPGLGQLNEAIGAAFTVPVGGVSKALTTDQGIVILRVDRRVAAGTDVFEAQKAQQRASVTPSLRERRVRDFIDGLRKTATIKDRRKEIAAAAKRSES